MDTPATCERRRSGRGDRKLGGIRSVCLRSLLGSLSSSAGAGTRPDLGTGLVRGNVTFRSIHHSAECSGNDNSMPRVKRSKRENMT